MTGQNTETLDKLYLEWSQFTQARTWREIKLFQAAKQVCAFDWSGNDSDAVAAIDDLRRVLKVFAGNLITTKIDLPKDKEGSM